MQKLSYCSQNDTTILLTWLLCLRVGHTFGCRVIKEVTKSQLKFVEAIRSINEWCSKQKKSTYSKSQSNALILYPNNSQTTDHIPKKVKTALTTQ